MTTLIANDLKLADEVWIATALLHKEHPQQPDFSVEEIVDRVKSEGLTEPLRRGVYTHVQMHCVANRPPEPNRYRMLLETAPGRRRLFRPGDPYDQRREGSKITPSPAEIPEKYKPLLRWYSEWSKSDKDRKGRFDALLSLVGSGRDLWAKEHADEYVNRLRAGWE
jgi:hypothetical protein